MYLATSKTHTQTFNTKPNFVNTQLWEPSPVSN